MGLKIGHKSLNMGLLQANFYAVPWIDN